MFTTDNTQDFTATDLKLLNAALAQMLADGYDEQNASDIINNNWVESGNTIQSLTRI